MSKYTTDLRWLIESGYNLGLKTYPIFEESYRSTLNQKILSHYKFREIGFETAGLFKDRLNEKMELIMPYYNQLYKSALLEFNPLTNSKMQETTENKKNENTATNTTQKITGTTDTTSDRNETINDTTTGTKTNSEDGTNHETSSDTKSRKEVGSDTPQGLLSIGNIDGELYASTAAIGSETDSHTEDSTHNITSNEKTDGTYKRTTSGSEISNGNTSQDLNGDVTAKTDSLANITHMLEGYSGTSASELLQQFRATFLNIDAMVIAELETLFMCVY